MQTRMVSHHWFLRFPATLSLVGINFLVFLVLIFNGVPLNTVSPDILMSWGGNTAVLTLTGEYWRLLSNIFVHAGLLHLLANNYMLYIIGAHTERLYGRLNMVLLYLSGGVVASLTSAMWQSRHIEKIIDQPALFGMQKALTYQYIVSVGASGAIMALCGALLLGLLWQQQSISTANKITDKRLRSGLIQVILLNLVLGYWIKGIDQSAHVGGLLAGAMLGAGIWLVAEFAVALRRYAVVIVCVLMISIVAIILYHVSGNADLQKYRAHYMEQTQNPPNATE
ncbi:MAG: rhomboid family intramembrane serine protease [Gammaproteobacteria bacterium]|nr:rhomboid family intramembrane serine protease [Gammaproteobacteria bacterium]